MAWMCLSCKHKVDSQHVYVCLKKNNPHSQSSRLGTCFNICLGFPKVNWWPFILECKIQDTILVPDLESPEHPCSGKKCSALLHLELGSPPKKASEISSVKILACSLWFQNSCGLVMFHRKVLTLYLTVTVIKSIYCIICYSFVFISQLLLLIKCSLDFTLIWITLFRGQANGTRWLLKHDAIQNQQWVENCYVH